MKRSQRYLLGLGILILAIALIGQVLNPSQLETFIWSVIKRAGKLGILLFLLAYGFCCIFMLPVWMLTFGAGATYGVVKGTLLVWLGTVIGAWASFLVSRKLARRGIARAIRAERKLAALDRAIAEEGWKIVFLCRLSPIFPFALMSYLFGLTRVRPLTYLAATAAGVLLPNFLYVYAGYLVRLGVAEKALWSAQGVLYMVGFAATIAVTLLLIRIINKVLKQKELADLASQERSHAGRSA